jgi:hypothetical protein
MEELMVVSVRIALQFSVGWHYLAKAMPCGETPAEY